MTKLSPIPFKQKISESFLVGADFSGLFATTFGTAVTGFLGKLYLALILAGIALGFFLRLSNRRRVIAKQQKLPSFWVYPTAGLTAAFLTAVLVEITSLPYRFYQDGFAYWHWLLIAVALLATFSLALRIFKMLEAK
jgi:F0F1-type ATP synthase membrane subunit a